MVYMYHRFLIHLSAGGHLDCFHVLGIIVWRWEDPEGSGGDGGGSGDRDGEYM